MPELPEVETVCNGLRKFLIGKTLKTCQLTTIKLRNDFPTNFVQQIIGSIVTDVQRRGKYIIIHLQNDLSWVIHLGMSGQVRINQPLDFSAKKHDHVIWSTDTHIICYNDPRRFGNMFLLPTSTWHQNYPFSLMGIEPLSDGFNPTNFYQILQTKKTTIKNTLLDQKNIAGIGNIYACEALWLAKISPLKISCALTFQEASKLCDAIKEILNIAIKHGGTTLKDHRQVDGQTGQFQNFCRVYNQVGNSCKTSDCNGKIIRVTQNGRSSFYCDGCQKN